jgi:hypothetical protein
MKEEEEEEEEERPTLESRRCVGLNDQDDATGLHQNVR